MSSLIRTATALVFVAVAACLAVSPVADASFGGANGRIAFVSNRAFGGSSIFVSDSDGTHRTQLGAQGTGPRWSPDGTRIAFASSRDGNSEIYVMNADGSGQTRLTFYPGYDSHPAWTSDGRIVFTRIIGSNWEIFRMNADGTGEVNLTHSNTMEWGQATAPHGEKIAFTREDGGVGHLYTMNADAGQAHQVTNAGAYDSWPSWSPTGNDLIFTRDTADGSGSDLWIVHANGSGATQLTHQSSSGYVYSPVWSPDGTSVVYTQCGLWAANPCTVHTMLVDGTGDTDITTPRLPFLDTFEGSTLDSFWGSVFLSGSGVTTGISGGQFEVSVPSTATLDPSLGYITTGIGSQCAVRGDFDAQVDYRLLDWGSPAGINLGFGLFPVDYSETHGLFVHDDGFGTGVSTGFPGPVNTFVFDSSRNGTLRLQRVGSTLSAYRLTAAGWSLLQSIEMTTRDQLVNLNVFSNSTTHPDAKVAYDNLRLSGAGLSCPSWWSDSQPDWQPVP